VADGVTTIYEPHHVDRGYEGFVDDLTRIGADVTRVDVD
jgi:UDP-N-acetylglucosamine 1-carboxyvinyltransferase